MESLLQLCPQDTENFPGVQNWVCVCGFAPCKGCLVTSGDSLVVQMGWWGVRTGIERADSEKAIILQGTGWLPLSPQGMTQPQAC